MGSQTLETGRSGGRNPGLHHYFGSDWHGVMSTTSLTFERIRRGGKQTVQVVHQHVAVGPGGQAIVAAGGVKGGGRKTRGPSPK
jgi:hypothetical protein